MEILRRSSGIIYPATGERFLSLLLDAGGSIPITCTLYPRLGGNGCIFALPSQKGCSVGCTFCSVPQYFGNLTANEILEIIYLLEENAAAAGVCLTGRNKMCFVKGGELFQSKFFDEILQIIVNRNVDLKISTVFPEGNIVRKNLEKFLGFCESFTKDRNIGFQFSALSTMEGAREKITKHPLLSFREVGEFGEKFFKLRRRKVTISLTVTDDVFFKPEEILTTLSPRYFAVRVYPYKKNAKLLTPMSNVRCADLEKRFNNLGYMIIPCHNEYEREIGYFDEKIKFLKSWHFNKNLHIIA